MQVDTVNTLDPSCENLRTNMLVETETESPEFLVSCCVLVVADASD